MTKHTKELNKYLATQGYWQCSKCKTMNRPDQEVCGLCRASKEFRRVSSKDRPDGEEG